MIDPDSLPHFTQSEPARQAIKRGDVDQLKAWMKINPELIKAPTALSGETLLMQAAAEGHLEMVQLLLPYSDPLCMDRSVGSALSHAASKGKLDCVLALLPHSDAQAVPEGPGAINALMWAVFSERVEGINALLPHSDPRFAAKNGRTALIIAAQFGLTQCVRALLPHSNAQAETVKGKTALHLALDQSAPLECVQLLAQHSAVSSSLEKGQALLRAAATHQDPRVIDALVMNSVDPLASALWIIGVVSEERQVHMPQTLALLEQDTLRRHLQGSLCTEALSRGETEKTLTVSTKNVPLNQTVRPESSLSENDSGHNPLVRSRRL